MSKTDKELDDLEARLPVIVETLASLNMDISLEAWNYISNNILSSADAIAELRKKNAGLVGHVERLKAIAQPLADERWNPDEYPCDAPATCLDLLRHQARHALKENTQ